MNRKEIEELEQLGYKRPSGLEPFPRSELTTTRYLLRKAHKELEADFVPDLLLNLLCRELGDTIEEFAEGGGDCVNQVIGDYFMKRMSLSEVLKNLALLNEDCRRYDMATLSPDEVPSLVEQFLQLFCSKVKSMTEDDIGIDCAHELIRMTLIPMRLLMGDFHLKMRLESNPKIAELKFMIDITGDENGTLIRMLQPLEDEEYINVVIDESELMRRWGKRSDPPA